MTARPPTGPELCCCRARLATDCARDRYPGYRAVPIEDEWTIEPCSCSCHDEAPMPDAPTPEAGR